MKNHNLLEDFYNNEIPGYIKSAGKTFMTIKIDGNDEKITIKDVIKYYKTQAPNISSGYRSLARFGGDWRPIDNLANEVLEWFKYSNINELRKESIKMNLEPKF